MGFRRKLLRWQNFSANESKENMKNVVLGVVYALLCLCLMSGQALAQSETSAGAPAAAEEPAAVKPASPEVEKKSGWYGDQLLYVYGGSIAACILGAVGSSQLQDGDLLVASLCTAGGVGMVTGGFIVHGAHGYWGKAFISLGMSVGLPIAGLFLGALTGDGLGALAGAAFGFLGGGIVTPIIDVGWQAYHPEDEESLTSAFGRQDMPVYGLKFTFALD